MDGSADDPTPEAADYIEFHLIKSPQFRVIHVDGGLGGITPRGFCHIALYNERQAIPQLMTRELLEGGELGDEEVAEVRGREAKAGIVREIEIDLIFNEQTAQQLHEWLGRRLEEFVELEAALKKKAGDENG